MSSCRTTLSPYSSPVSPSVLPPFFLFLFFFISKLVPRSTRFAGCTRLIGDNSRCVESSSSTGLTNALLSATYRAGFRTEENRFPCFREDFRIFSHFSSIFERKGGERTSIRTLTRKIVAFDSNGTIVTWGKKRGQTRSGNGKR